MNKKTISSIFILVIVIASLIIYSQYKKNDMTVTYKIEGTIVSKQEFEDFKSKLSIDENFTEGILYEPVPDGPGQSGFVQIHKATKIDGGASYEYSLKSINRTTEYSIDIVASPGYALFQDTDFPFTFEYPADWNTVELSTDGQTPNGVFDNRLKNILIGKGVSVKPEIRNIGEWFVISKGETPFPSNARPPSTKIILDGREASMFDVGSGLIQISVGSNVYEIQFNSKGTLSNKFEKLKSSFRFNGLVLFFYAGGSITGNSFEVGLTGSEITYREFGPDKKELRKIDYPLTSVELADIREVIMNSGLISLETENLTDQMPSQNDPGSYNLFVQINSKKNNIQCYIPSYHTKPTNECQKKIDVLRLKLNNILGVNIY